MTSMPCSRGFTRSCGRHSRRAQVPSPLPLSLQERGSLQPAPSPRRTRPCCRPPSRGRSRRRRASRRRCGVSSASPTGAPLTNQAKGGTPPRALSASRASRAPSAMPRSTRAPSGGKAIFSAAVSVAAMVLGASLRRWRSGGGRSAVTRADKTPFGCRMISTSRPRRAKASNRIGAAACRPTSPGVGPLSGRPTQTAIVVYAVEADRQRVAKAVGRAGLEGDAARQRIRRRRAPTQNVGDIPGRDRIGDPARTDDRGRAVEPLDQRRRLAPAGKAGVETGEVGQRNAEAAEADREADRRVLRQRDLRARAVQASQKRRRPDVGEKLDRRQVQATSAAPCAPSPCPDSRGRNFAARKPRSAPAGRTAPSPDAPGPPRRRARR